MVEVEKKRKKKRSHLFIFDHFHKALPCFGFARRRTAIMGEVAVSSDEMVAKKGDAAGNDGDGGDRKGGSSCGVVKWERFLPRMVLRVLLVEADDSTRQIISALLRKCNYRVAAVPDGLKAWEILKGRPHSIDLILTEVDLPSISGYPLLTLIMEHDVCKNIPVIMMSSQDSISTVYKCMMRGAADYLVKPIRTNELRNLWQHVWRRQSATAGTTGEQDECAALQKVEATAENNAASNHSSVNRDKELIEKGSDAQSSCTKPDLDADIREIEQKQGNAKEMDILTPEAVRSSDRRLLGQDKGSDEGLAVARSSQNKDTDPEVPTNDAIVASGCNDVIVNSYKEAINLIGAFDNHTQSICMDSSSNYGTREAQPELGLSLLQSDPSCLTDHKTGERHTLRQSDASAFSKYISKPLRFVQSGLANFQNQDQEFGRNTEQDGSCAVRSYDTDNLDTVEGSRNLARHSEYYVQQQAQKRLFPAPIPVRGLMKNLSTDYGSLPRAAEPFVRVDSFQQSSCENNNFGDQNDVKFDSLEDHRGGHISPTTDRSGSSSFCNGALTHLNSMDGGSICGSNENNVNQFPVSRPTPVGETMVGEGTTTTVQRSILREAALAKFRLKRKDRCYEKKVRYESRKKLAEQRPRVKGQFVRQTQTEPASGEGVANPC